MKCAARALPILLAGLFLAACGAPPDPPERPARPNLLLVTLDTTRADRTSLFDSARSTTPALKALAAKGASFASAYAPSPSTGPTHATLFTGLYPIGHGVVKNTLALPEEQASLPAVLEAAGYATSAVVSSFVLQRRFGFARGFEEYRDDFPPEQATLQLPGWEGIEVEAGFDRRADHTTDLALAWLRGRDTDLPFFLFVHYFDPHFPYTPPADFAARFASGAAPGSVREAIDLYDAELAFTDHQLGRLLEGLDALGLGDDTLVVVVGDHGEGLMDHGHMEHGIQLFEEAVQVPWVWRWPGVIAAGRVIEGPVQLVDLAPTLHALMGLGLTQSSHGIDLSPVLRGEAMPDAERPVFLQTDRPAALEDRQGLRGAQWSVGEGFGMRRGPWKYLEDRARSQSALYHLGRDPAESQNLRDEDPALVAALSEQLAQWKRAHLRPEFAAPELSESEIEAFRALGYIE